MKKATSQVLAFHQKNRLPVADVPQPIRRDPVVADLANALRPVLGRAIARQEADPRNLELARARYMLEELSETFDALAKGDSVGVLDGLADLAYVVVGTAIAFGLPLAEAFGEVHRSNLTKGGLTAAGKGGKGDGYQPPQLRRILERAIDRGVAVTSVAD